MKKTSKIFATLFLSLAFLLTANAWAQKNPKDNFDFPKLNPLKIPPVKQVTLGNGIKLFLVEDRRFPTISMEGVFFTGSALEPADKLGLASLTATVLRSGGSQKISGDQVDRELETMAASIGTSMDKDSGSVSLSMLKENSDRVLAILSDILRHPSFNQEKIDLAKIEARSVVSRRNDAIDQITSREFAKLIYGASSPYARHPEYATIDAVTRDDMVAFYKKYFHPNNLWLAVWGDFDTNEMIAKIKKSLGPWEKSTLQLPSLPVVAYDFKSTVNYIEKTDVNQSNIMMGHIGGVLNSPDYPALAVMNRILSFDRMFKKIRTDEGLAYTVWGQYVPGLKVPGTFSAGAQTKSQSTVKAIRIMLEEMDRITKEEVTDLELKRAKDQFLNSYVFVFDSRAKIIQRMLAFAYYGYPLDFAEQLFKKIEKVTRADILQAAKKHLRPGAVQILVVGKQADFDKPLSELGRVNTIDIAIPVPKTEAAPKATPEALAKGKDLFNKSIAAMGDPAKIQAIKNVKYVMDFTQITPMGEMKMAADLLVVYPDRMLFSLNTPNGMVTMVVTKEKGMVKMAQGAMPLPDAQQKSFRDNIMRDPVYVWQNADKYQFQFLGTKKMGDRELLDLLISGPVDPFHFYVDPQSFLSAGASYQTIGQNGPEMVLDSSSDYRPVDGLKMPFKNESYSGKNKISEQVIKEIQLNVPVDEAQFKLD